MPILRKLLLSICLIALLSSLTFAQKRISNETEEQKQKRMAWWTNDRFGMFIHWGLYALPARHEWVKRYERMTNEQYQPYFDLFNPDLFDPKVWAKTAKAAGMKYAVLTTKHHDGFCLFDSKYTDYKATNTAAKRDLVREFAEACRAEGLKVGFYYSLLDWHHPNYPVDALHPQQPASDADADYAQLNTNRDIQKYRTYMHNQIRELLTNYGKVDELWLDFSFPGKHGKGKEEWGSVELLKMIRKLQPDIIVDNRLDLDDYEDGIDFVTPEQYKVPKWPTMNGKKVAWETCQTFSGSWGYYRDEKTWKSPRQLIELLVETVSKGGNLLLNVGPTARGEFDYRAQDALQRIATWMKYNNRAIYGCTQAPDDMQAPQHTLLTYHPETKRLYIHLLDYPLGALILPGLKGKVKYAQFLHDNSEVKFTTLNESYSKEDVGSNDLMLSLPVNQPPSEIPVIELVLQE